MSAIGQEMTLQDGKRGTERVQTKVGKTHIDYWYGKVHKRHYTGRNGEKVEIPDWHVRLKHLGRTIWLNLRTANRAEAATKAKEIYIFLCANGLEATLAKFKPQTEQKDDMTVDEFADLYREQLVMVEYPPMKRTAERYIDSFQLICRLLRITRIGMLSSEYINNFRCTYLKRGLEKGRSETCVKNSCNTLLRSAASLYSRQMLEAYTAKGIEIANPFVGRRFRKIELKPYTPLPRELLDSIWRESAKLRDGNPEVPAPPKTKWRKRRKGPNLPKLKRHRWIEPDWRKPHQGAYVILLLELGVGFRREESDKAEWGWFFTDKDGRHYIEVRKTDFFTPKGKRRRILPVENVLWDAIHETRTDLTPFIVPGNTPKKYAPSEEPINIPYRCEKSHRVLVAWLRKMGVNDGRPCHLLRKEFGSYVATSFGLFVAQRLLGHSSPAVTEAFYAGLTNLPELQHAQIPRHG